ncbi:hypothetical protein [Halobaculum sp. P14]|uniref:hypothetical protein n=1 Tax=Halobaculum sp. P14 TaxID=3421638 RepID=UPI003EBF9360
MASDEPDREESRLLARAYDDVDGGHIADVYSWEAVVELEGAWWVRIEEVAPRDE